ncbi:protein of unknown function [Petrocella atlantisensis]|uniref:Uncharacterized protein n=1 Tax=Petrocella atlantisensis TaxID=2173034 RepID=A0A3P7Q0R2_9FIRM|nr:protein of unknown function [Petrocella atlantisensis]
MLIYFIIKVDLQPYFVEQRGYASICEANCYGRKDFLNRLHSIDFPRVQRIRQSRKT